jgi:hypothetical protein
MVTRDEIYQRLGRPFSPFSVMLAGGEKIDVVRLNQAVVSTREFIVGMPNGRTRWIALSNIEGLKPYELPKRAG